MATRTLSKITSGRCHGLLSLNGIPYLLIVDNDGKLVKENGVDDVKVDFEKAFEIWGGEKLAIKQCEMF